MMNKRLASGMSKRTAKVEVVALRNILKQTCDVDELIQVLPVPTARNRLRPADNQRRGKSSEDEPGEIFRAITVRLVAISAGGLAFFRDGFGEDRQHLRAR